MILTGKAKEDFEKWYFENQCQSNISFEELMPHHKLDIYGWLYSQSDTMVNAFVIDWLDTVGFHVMVEPHIGGGADVYFAKVIYRRADNFIDTWVDIQNDAYSDPDDNHFSSRQEATKAAIEKANSIYNQRA